MIKVLQFGEGNFLRTFVDIYFQTLNEEGGNYSVDIVKPITFGSLENFVKQDNKYHVVLRGVKDGAPIEKPYKIDVLNSVTGPEDYDKICNLFADKELKIIVSNTTEAGICYNGNDKMDGFIEVTYPAKLTKLLYHRFCTLGGTKETGVYLMPVELIDNNANELKKCVDKYIELWNLPAEFKAWNDTYNFYCNTLVDRIVSGHPKTPEQAKHLEEVLGEKDLLVSVGEPFGLWAVEKKGDIADYIKEGVHNIEVVLTTNIGYYKKRKVRVLNGSHTNLVPAGLWLGMETVYDCMENPTLCKFLNDTLAEEIVPFVSDDVKATTVFADSIIERFSNPYLNHLLISISLNSISKWRARNLCSFTDYYNKYGKIPANLTIGFSYLMAIYSSVVKEDEQTFTAELPNGKIRVLDDIPYLEFFANGGKIEDFMKDEAVWGENLDNYKDFVATVVANVEQIKGGKNLL